jgi:hypothetical protein
MKMFQGALLHGKADSHGVNAKAANKVLYVPASKSAPCEQSCSLLDREEAKP